MYLMKVNWWQAVLKGFNKDMINLKLSLLVGLKSYKKKKENGNRYG